MACAASSITAMPRSFAASSDRRHVGRLAEQVHRHDRLGARRDRGIAAAASMLKVSGSMSTSTGFAPTRATQPAVAKNE